MEKTRQHRRLSLSRETLRNLGATDLRKVKGGALIGVDPNGGDQLLFGYNDQDFGDNPEISAVGCGSLAC